MSGIAPNLTKPVTGTPLSTYAEGSIIKINESGSPVEFYVAKHNYEAGLNGAGRTLVVRKDCFDKRIWNSNSLANPYATSTIDSWLNGDYKSLLSTGIGKVIETTKFKYTLGNGDYTIGTLDRAVFLLSVTELGKTAIYAHTEGTALSIANSLQIAYLNGAAVEQWTRSPYVDNTNNAFILYTNGAPADRSVAGSYGSRPCFTLPSTIKIDENGQVIE